MTVSDEFWMQQALALALDVRKITPPHPWVGSIIERKGAFLAKGSTAMIPEHIPAEIVALEALKKKEIYPQDSTLYTILEPSLETCQAIVASGVTTVVIGTLDPDPNIFGKSVRMLRESGLTVRIGPLERKIAFELRSYLHYKIRKESYAVLKLVQSLNGGLIVDKETLLGEEALYDEDSLTQASQAILINAQRIILPSTAQKQKKTILQIVVDEAGILTPSPETLYITTKIVASAKNLDPNQPNLLVWDEPRPISFSWIKANLAKRGILQLLIDGDNTLISQCIAEQAFDELILYLVPYLSETVPAEPLRILQQEALRLAEMMRFGHTAKLLYLPQSEMPYDPYST